MNSSSQYEVGQVLFIVLNKKGQVYPMQISEVIHKKTLKGEETKYVLRGGTDKSVTLMLDEVEGEIFDSSDKARKSLVQRATQQVNNIVDMAVKKSKEWYGDGEDSRQKVSNLPDLPDLQDLKQEDTATEVMLPDGTIAKIKLPTAV
mgnify:CR=1 FL=1